MSIPNGRYQRPQTAKPLDTNESLDREPIHREMQCLLRNEQTHQLQPSCLFLKTLCTVIISEPPHSRLAGVSGQAGPVCW